MAEFEKSVMKPDGELIKWRETVEVRHCNWRYCIIKPYKRYDVCGYHVQIPSAQQTEGTTIV